MKTRKHFDRMLLLAMLLVFIIPVQGRTMRERQEKITREITITPATRISFENKNGPVKVETWDKNAIKVDIQIVIDGEDNEINKVLEALRNLEFIKDNETVLFKTRFYKMMSGVIPGHFKVILLNGTTVRLNRLDLSYVLTIPKNNTLSVKNAYDRLILPNLSGKLNLDLYECDLTAGTIANDAEMQLKYGKATVDSVMDVKLTLYENDLSLTKAGDIRMDSKYSSVGIMTAGSLNIDSYEDKITVARHGDVSAVAKYTTLNLAGFNRGTFDLYECQLKTGDVNILAIGAKYTLMEFQSCRALVFTTSYENKLRGGIIGDLKASSNYSSYRIDRFEGKITFTSSYEDEIMVKSVSKKFIGIDLDGKYTELNLIFETDAAYKIDADTRYTDFDYRKEFFREIRYHKEDEEFRYVAVTQGADESTAPVISLRMYEGKVVLR